MLAILVHNPKPNLLETDQFINMLFHLLAKHHMETKEGIATGFTKGTSSQTLR